MPLVGGGGAGNIAGGANPAGTGSGLNYIGDHCYAYSGIVASAGSQSAATTSTLLFTTGNSYAKVIVTFSNNNISATANEYYEIKFDSQVVYKAENEHGIDTVTNPTLVHMIIPPYTTVQTFVGSSADAYDHTTIITGRVYA